MKSKLVRYPFNDGKRYRWDTYKMGKKFEYYWEQSEPNNYDTITPYIKYSPVVKNGSKNYGFLNMAKDAPSYIDYGDIKIRPDFTGTDGANLYKWKSSGISRHPIIYHQVNEDYD